MDASPFTRPSTQLTGRRLVAAGSLLPAATSPVHRGGCRVTREGRNAVEQPREAWLDAMPDAMALPVGHHLEHRPEGKEGSGVMGTGCAPIFGLFVQDCSCWTRWNQHDPRLIRRKGSCAPSTGLGLAGRGVFLILIFPRRSRG